jgi:hypothetical protein
VVVDAAADYRMASPLGSDALLRVILDGKAPVAARGIDARLAGSVEVSIAAADGIAPPAEGSEWLKGGYKT